MKIVNIVIAYKNTEEVVQYAKRVSELDDADTICLVIVVNDYGDSDYEGLRNKLTSISLQTEIYEAGKNLGYFNGFLYGVNRYMDQAVETPKWFILSNTDIEYKEPNFYSGFLSGKYDDNIWCVGPSIYNINTGNYENNEHRERISARKMRMLSFIKSRRYVARIHKKLHDLKSSAPSNYKPESGCVYEVHGSFFGLKTEFVNLLRKKEYGAFLYAEEIFVAEEIRKYGKKTYYDSDIEILHHEHSVTGTIPFALKTKYEAESLRFLTDTYFR